MGLGGSHGGDDALAHPGDDGLFARAAYQAVDVGPHRDLGLTFQLDAVDGHGGDHRGFDDLGVDAHLHRFQHVAAGQVDGGGPLEGQRYIGALGGDQGVDHPVHVAAGQIVGLQLGHGRIQTGLFRLDQRVHDLGGGDPAQAHADEVEDAHLGTGGQGGDPQAHRDEAQQNEEGDEDDEDDGDGGDQSSGQIGHNYLLL